MRPDEIRDTGALTGAALGELTEVVRDVHRALAGRLSGLAGESAGPVRLMHDGIAAIAYGSTRVGVTVLPAAAGLVAGTLHDPEAESAHDSRRGRAVLGAVNGLWGDRVADRHAALAPCMRMRTHDGPLRRLAAHLARDVGTGGVATGRLVVFVHGLCETDLCWSFAAGKRWGDPTCTYGSMLRDHDGWTPLYLNFNTGKHVSVNGREFADQLEELVDAWPVPVTEIALVGHSLGGLVARGAAHQADDLDHRWVRRLRHVVGLGTPHFGAPLERFTHRAVHRMARLPETRPIAAWLDRRSVGVKDLRCGAVVEADWCDTDADYPPRDRGSAVRLVPGVAHAVVSATLSRRPVGPFANDLLVQHSSAHGIGKIHSIPFDPEWTFHLGGNKHHLDLLADPTVYDKLRVWLGGAEGASVNSQPG